MGNRESDDKVLLRSIFELSGHKAWEIGSDRSTFHCLHGGSEITENLSIWLESLDESDRADFRSDLEVLWSGPLQEISKPLTVTREGIRSSVNLRLKKLESTVLVVELPARELLDSERQELFSSRILTQAVTQWPLGLVIQDVTGAITFCNQSALEVLGLTESQMRGRTSMDPRWRAVKEDGSDFPGSEHPAMACLADGEPRREVVMGVHRPDGSLKWISINSDPVREEESNEVIGAVTVFADITYSMDLQRKVEDQILQVHELNIHLELQSQELEQANTSLQALAITDGLTELRNHRFLKDTLAAEYLGHTIHAKPLSVIMMDVDKFKSYNDTFGHPAGDQVLRTIAKILWLNAPMGAVCARYGGEEFCIVLPSTDIKTATAIAEVMRQAIEAHAWERRQVTCSFGVASASQKVSSADELLAEVDGALYQSKVSGRNRVSVSDWLRLEKAS